MTTSEVGTLFGSLRMLCRNGIRFSTVIDVGCADGHFFLNAYAAGLLEGAVPFNIDANPIYESSLQSIQKVVGGYFRVGVISDREGEVDFTMSAHPYWSSLRPKHDPYWRRINNLSASTGSLPATTLDALNRELGLHPPFLLKLDVQGGEQNVLRGGFELLQKTHVVICEADVDDFQELNAILVQNNFVLYDLTHLQRSKDGTLGWFYPIYINRAIEFVRPTAFWDARDNEVRILDQIERRKAILSSNEDLLARISAIKRG